MTVQELEQQLLRLQPTDKLRMIQILAQSLNALWGQYQDSPVKLSEFFRQSPLAEVTATGELDLSRDHISRVELGEEIIISNRGVPVAKLVPFSSASNRHASLGMDRGRFMVPDDFNAPLPEEILAAFEGCDE